ncbi:MAG: trigger factor [Bacteroidales bacterium]|nr:trigger factor [Bacteroidales bacterium]
MNITKENKEDLTALVKIEITKEDYQDQVSKELKEYQRKAKIPGFRPGKVPFGMIKKMYGKAVIAEEINKIISESITKYIEENKIGILGQPLPNLEKNTPFNFEEETDFEFYFDLGLAPEIEIDVNDEIEVDYYDIKAEKEIIDNYISEAMKRMGETINPDKSDEGDVLEGEIEELNQDVEVLEGGIKNETSIVIDLIKDKTIQKKLIGLKKDDTLVFNPLKATESEVETATMLGIKKEEVEKNTSDFRFTINKVSRIVPAELDENFYKSVYPQLDINDEDQFRKQVEIDAKKSLDNESNKHFMNESIKKLLEIADFSMPDEFMKRWLYENQGDEKEVKSKEAIGQEYDAYRDSMKVQLLENKIIKKYDLQVTGKEIRDHIKEIYRRFAPMDGLSPEEVEKNLDELANSILKNEKEVERIHSELFDKKLLDFLKSNLKLNKKEVNHKEFIKFVTEK